MRQSSQQQAGRNKKHHGDRHLHANERIAQPAARTPNLGTISQHVVEVRSRGLEGRRKTKPERGNKHEQKRVGEDAHVRRDGDAERIQVGVAQKHVDEGRGRRKRNRRPDHSSRQRDEEALGKELSHELDA